MEENELLEIWQEAGCVKSRDAGEAIHSHSSVSGRIEPAVGYSL